MAINAIIMAAGKGERLRPLTETTPKPLIEIHGTPMIENIITSLKQKGVDDITIVTGYLKDKFEYLKDKHQINIINNPDYDKANNISSLYYAKEKLGDTIILDGDQIINNLDIIKLDFTKSGYVCVPINTFKREWILSLDKNNKITSCLRDGGDHGYELKSLSFWTRKDTEKLKQLLVQEYENKGRANVYWDDVAMFLHPDKFELYGYIIKENDIEEIDSLEELQAIDERY